MQQQTAQNVNDIIDHLATKLSVPATQLWTILVQQARVEAIQTIVTDCVWLLFIAAYLVTWRRVERWVDAEQKTDKNAGGAGIFWCFAAGAVSIVGLVLTVTSLNGIITALVNPQYYALSKVLDVVKK